MSLFEMHVCEPWFSFIESGRKKVEGRKRSEKWKNIKVGDTIKMFCGEPSYRFFYVQVKNIRLYPDLKSYLICEGLENTLPGVNLLEEGEKVYLQYSTLEEIKKYGIMAIKLEIIITLKNIIKSDI